MRVWQVLKKRSQLLVVMVLALTLSVGMGPSVASHLVVRSGDIVNGQVKARDLGKGAVATQKLRNKAVKATKIGKGAVVTGKVRKGAITMGKLRNDAVKRPKIANGAVSKAKLAPNARPMWAVVDVEGTGPNPGVDLVRGSHAADATDTISTGRFVVTFDRNVRGCAYVANPGLTAPNTGLIADLGATVHSNGTDPKGVIVQTFRTSTGSLENVPFHLHVLC